MPATFFLVTSRYTAPPEAIDLHLAAHRSWLGDLYGRGLLVVSGRLASGQGGFMLARGIARAELEALLATDPFRLEHLLVHEIQELAANRWCGALDALEGAP